MAFKPVSATRVAPCDHLQLNRLPDRVDIVDAAVSDYVGNGTLRVRGTSGENTLNPARFPPGDEACPTTVPVTTIDSYCQVHGVVPAVIELDVEGSELRALRGASQVLCSHRPAIVLELHPAGWHDSEEPERTAALLAALSYRVIPLVGQEAPFHEGGHILLAPGGEVVQP